MKRAVLGTPAVGVSKGGRCRHGEAVIVEAVIVEAAIVEAAIVAMQFSQHALRAPGPCHADGCLLANRPLPLS
jgi:hypothetical protein